MTLNRYECIIIICINIIIKKGVDALEQSKIDRINELASKAKVTALTEEELAEQKALREEYIADFRRSLRGILDNTVIERPDGPRENLGEKYGEKNK